MVQKKTDSTLTCAFVMRYNIGEGVREFQTLESTVFGRARLLPSHALVPRIRLSRSFALPIPGHPHIGPCTEHE